MASTQCPNCKSKFRIPEEKAAKVSGKSVECKKCGDRFVIVLDTNTPQPKANSDLTTGNRASRSTHINVSEQQRKNAPNDGISKISEVKIAELRDAINNGEIEAVRLLIRNYPSVVNMKVDGTIPLHMALDGIATQKPNHLEMAKLVLPIPPQMSSINDRNAYGYTALHLNSRCGDTAMARILINAGADLSIRNPNDGSTPLHIAAIEGKDNLIDFLIQQGAEINARDTKYGATALHFAASNNYTSTIELLLVKGADSQIKDDKGRTPLVLAQQLHQAHADLNLNGSIRVLTQYEKSAVSLGQQTLESDQKKLNSDLFSAVENDETDKIHMLLQKGASHRAVDKQGNTPLHIAARKEHLRCCTMLVKAGASTRVKNDDGQTPYQYAEDFIQRVKAAMTIGNDGIFVAEMYEEMLKELRNALDNATIDNATIGKTGCFIATAIYESPESVQVRTLRNFRDEALLSYKLGKAFVSWYYRTSPPIAKFLTNHRFIKKFIRFVLLDPIVFMINKFNFYR